MRRPGIGQFARGVVLLFVGAWAFFIPSKTPPAATFTEDPPTQPGAPENACRAVADTDKDAQSEKPVLFIGCGGGF